jgi:hypothetical protein
MNKIYNFPIDKYNFSKLVEDYFEKDLSELHLSSDKNYELFKEVGKDSNTEFHNKFYKKLNSDWKEIHNLYDQFLKEIVNPIVKNITGEPEFVYQKFPTFRVHLPNNVAVTEFHKDSQPGYNHPEGEINFVIPLTKMYDSNTIWAESSPGKNNIQPLNLEIGELLCWNFNKCLHGNKINESKHTRVSMDFRVLPMSKYKSIDSEKGSATTKNKFKIGSYYKTINL